MTIPPLTAYEEAIRGHDPEDFVQMDDQSIFVQDQGLGHPLVMLHGFASSAYSFRELFTRLPQHRLIAIDLNGFGLTQRPKALQAYRITHQANLIAAVIAKKGIGEATVLGHSYGAAVASVMAKRHPALARRLVLVSPPSNFDRTHPFFLSSAPAIQVMYWFSRFLLSSPQRFRRMGARAFHVDGVFTDEISEVYRKSLLVEGLREACFGYARAFREKMDERVDYAGIRQPTLVVVGQNDSVVPAESCQILSRSIPGCACIVIPDCGHCTPEERPDELARILNTFLARPVA